MSRTSATSFGDFWEAIRGTPLKTFIVCLAGVTLSSADQALFSYVIPNITEEFSIDLEVIGQILSLSFLVASFALIAVGIIADYWGRKRMFVAILALSAACVGLHAVATNLGWLTVFRVLGFAIAAGIYPITNTLLVEVMPARYRGLAGWLQISYPLGFVLASLVAAPLISHYGWRAAFVPAFLVIPMAFMLGRSLQESRRFRSLSAGAKSTAAGKPPLREHIGQLFGSRFRRRTLGSFLGSFFVSLAIGGMTYFMPTYFVQDRGLSTETATLLVGASYAIGVVGYLVAAYIGEFLTTRRTAMVSWVWLGACAFSLTLWFTDSALLLTIGYGFTIMFVFGSEAIRMPMISELFPTHIRATATVVGAALAVTTAWLIAPLALTLLVEPLGWSMAFTLLAVLPLALGGSMFLFLPNIESGLEVEQSSA